MFQLFLGASDSGIKQDSLLLVGETNIPIISPTLLYLINERLLVEYLPKKITFRNFVLIINQNFLTKSC